MIINNNECDIMANTDIYKVTKDLESKGYVYDDTGVYVPYTHKNEEYYDSREVYLKIEREYSNKLRYTFVKLEDGLFYPMGDYISEALICAEDKKLATKLSQMGRRFKLNAGNGVYKKFVDSFKDTITSADCLEVLKVDTFTLPDNDNLTNLTVPYEKYANHNFVSLIDLAELILGKPEYEYHDKFPAYVSYKCPFHDDNNPSALIYDFAFKCQSEKIQLDQTGFLMKYFNLNTPKEAEEKFQELMKNS